MAFGRGRRCSIILASNALSGKLGCLIDTVLLCNKLLCMKSSQCQRRFPHQHLHSITTEDTTMALEVIVLMVNLLHEWDLFWHVRLTSAKTSRQNHNYNIWALVFVSLGAAQTQMQRRWVKFRALGAHLKCGKPCW